MAHILVIEDEPLLASAVTSGLRDERHAVDVMATGALGLQAAERTSYDLVVLDLLLPELPGLDVCRRLRASGRHMPILLLTARDAPVDIVAGLDAGADSTATVLQRSSTRSGAWATSSGSAAKGERPSRPPHLRGIKSG